jgi:Ca2+-binding RTX toxin-like protein
MLRRVTLMFTLAAIAAVLLALGAGGTAAGVKPTTSEPIKCADQKGNVCQGTGNSDTIIGTDGDDNISPGFGDDVVYAGPGNDQVRHSGGKDDIEGGPGADTLRGGFGLDTIFGNAPTTDRKTGQVIDSADNSHDLIDCAYLESRGDPQPDEGYGEPTDTVVDCSNRDDL